MRDLIVVALVFASLPYGFRRPFVGLMVFSWLAYMRPQDLCWGFARSMRLSLLAGLTMVVGWLAFEFGRRPFTKWTGRSYLLAALLFFVSVSLFTKAYVIDRYVTTSYIEFVKIILVALFTLGQVDTKQRLRMMLWVIAISLGFYGFKGGLWGILTGGSVIKQGPGGMLGDNNDFALAMVMNMPLLYYLGREEDKLVVRRWCDAAFFFSAVTVLLTHSRGGFLSMVVVIMLIAWRSGKLMQAVLMLGLAAFVFVMFAPDHVMERLLTLKQGSAEGSANARIRSWTVAMRIIADNPWLGVGMRNFTEGYKVYGQDFLSYTGEAHVAHNSYFQIWAEAGTLSFIVYMSLLASIFVAARKVRRASRGIKEFAWAYSYSRAFEITTAGFMLGSFFLNRGHFDLVYHWVVLSGALLLIFQRDYAKYRAGTLEAEHSDQMAAQTQGIQVRRRKVQTAGVPVWSRTS